MHRLCSQGREAPRWKGKMNQNIECGHRAHPYYLPSQRLNQVFAHDRTQVHRRILTRKL